MSFSDRVAICYMPKNYQQMKVGGFSQRYLVGGISAEEDEFSKGLFW